MSIVFVELFQTFTAPSQTYLRIVPDSVPPDSRSGAVYVGDGVVGATCFRMKFGLKRAKRMINDK
ncbi:MAG: hypothetical protein ACD_50C00327G0001 [uncultured bacterium]|nr:MAG: hypothetical protein ACD_50C00327G0001 [uncultured bacterium]